MIVKVVLSVIGLMLSAYSFASSQLIHCESATTPLLTVSLQSMNNSNQYEYRVNDGGQETAGVASHFAFTTGESFDSSTFKLGISPLMQGHPDFFPNRWAKFWAIATVNGRDEFVGCAKLD